MEDNHGGSRSSTNAAPVPEGFAMYCGAERDHVIPFRMDAHLRRTPVMAPGTHLPSEIVVDRDMGEEWQRAGRKELIE